MKAGNQAARIFLLAKDSALGMSRSAGALWKGALAALTGSMLFLANAGKSARNTAMNWKDHALHSSHTNSEEVFHMKKSTVVALVVALAAVAGVLGALYFYVLRREKELDEYEQLLFSEDFNDDMLDDEPAEEEN